MSPTNNDTGLREKLIAVLSNVIEAPRVREEFADRILALPEIAEALRFVEGSPGFTATVQTAIAKS